MTLKPALKNPQPKTKKRTNLEHQIQTAIVDYLRLKHYTVLAIANGGYRNPREGKRLKDEGVLAGASDLLVILDNGRSIFLEVKTPTGRQQPNQREFEHRLLQLGHRYHVVRSIDDVERIIRVQEALS